MVREPGLSSILEFFDQISLPYQFASLPMDTFLPGIQIENGVLLVDLGRLSHVGDLLHEAGHIAVTSGAERHQLCGNVDAIGEKGGEEMAAIAWSWAALTQLGLPPEVVFHPEGYRGGSANYIEGFRQHGGFGHPLLSYFGMCLPYGEIGGFPVMTRWLRG